MPQLWTETFISQYAWLLLILLTFYYFISIKVIPTISETLKIRQITEATKQQEQLDFIDEKAINLFNSSIKQQIDSTTLFENWDSVQLDWLSTNPEENNQYWIDTTLTSETSDLLETEEESDLTLEEFLQPEELK